MDQLLDSFRADWQAEVRSGAIAQPATAQELYHLAVISERDGRLNDALLNYRAAFRLDPDVDKSYHRDSLLPSVQGSAAPPSLPTGFKFERTIQLYPDYKEGEDGAKPSTVEFREQLLRSFAENPWERPVPSLGPDDSTTVVHEERESTKNKAPIQSIDETYASLDFIPADPALPVVLSALPHEVMVLILRALTLSSCLPAVPRKPHLDPPTSTSGTVIDRKRQNRGKLTGRTIPEEMKWIEEELDLDLESREREWKSDVESLERFSRSCRMARIITLEEGLWRDLTLRTYVAPCQLPREQEASSLVKDLYQGDWRRFYIEHPRIRLDGVYIAVVTYLRPGEGQSWTTPTHLITFYRYLRFYPNGLALSLLTTDAPTVVVKNLNPLLRVKGLTIGRWALRGDEVECWDLEDPMLLPGARRYSFRMGLRLRSTARGRMNKLDLLNLATVHRSTLELEDVPIKPTKPFYFSKVASFSLDSE